MISFCTSTCPSSGYIKDKNGLKGQRECQVVKSVEIKINGMDQVLANLQHWSTRQNCPCPYHGGIYPQHQRWHCRVLCYKMRIWQNQQLKSQNPSTGSVNINCHNPSPHLFQYYQLLSLRIWCCVYKTMQHNIKEDHKLNMGNLKVPTTQLLCLSTMKFPTEILHAVLSCLSYVWRLK